MIILFLQECSPDKTEHYSLKEFEKNANFLQATLGQHNKIPRFPSPWKQSGSERGQLITKTFIIWNDNVTSTS